MKISVKENREIIMINAKNTQNENDVEILHLVVPEKYEDFNKKIVFITPDGVVWDLIEGDTYTLKRAITKYERVDFYIWLTKGEQDFRSVEKTLILNKNHQVDGEVTPAEETEMERVISILEGEITKVNNLDIDANKIENTTTVTITDKNGNEKTVEVLDGQDGQDAKINGYNTLNMLAGDNIEIEQEGTDLTINAVMYDDTEIRQEIAGKQNEITNNNKLSSDLVDDTNNTNKFVTTSEKTTWNNKSNFSGNYNDLTNKPTIPDELKDLSDDSTHRLVTDTEKTTWNNKSNFSGSYNDLSNKPNIPTTTNDLINNSNFVSDSNYVHTDNNYTTIEKTKLASLENYNDTEVKTDILNLKNNKADIIDNLASGSIANFTDGANNLPVNSLTVDIKPIQDLHGYNGAWGPGTGKNKLKCDAETGERQGVNYTVNADGSIKANRSSTSTRISTFTVGKFLLKANVEYILNGCPAGGNNSRYRLDLRDTETPTQIATGFEDSFDYGSGVSLISNEDIEVSVTIRIAANYAVSNLTFYPMIRLASESNSDFVPYSNICPISGWNGINIYHSSINTEDPEILNIVFSNEIGTVYGGNLNVTTGQLTITDGYIQSYNGETLLDEWTSDRDKYIEGTNPSIGAEVVYKLATPIIYQLTAQEIKTFLGTNNIWADTGNIQVNYKADTKLYVQNNFVSDSNYVHTDNNYTTIEKTKLSNIEANAQTNVIESISVNGITQTVTNKAVNINLNDVKVYGIKRSLTTTSSEWKRTDDAIGLQANATHDGSTVYNDFDNIYPWSDIYTYNYDISTDLEVARIGDANFKFDGTNGEVLTKIPEFYYKRWRDTEYEYIQISKYQFEGSIKSESFSVGRYDSTIINDSIHSYSGTEPEVNRNITSFRTLSNAVGTNFGQLDWRYFIIQLLYLVEYADYNSQNKLGNGATEFRNNANDKALMAESNVNRILVSTTVANYFDIGQQISIGTSSNGNFGVARCRTITNKEDYNDGNNSGTMVYFDGEPVNIDIGNVIWTSAQINGICDGLGMKSGCYKTPKNSCIYRGIENVFGNVWQFIDGLNIKNYVGYICYDPTEYTVDKFTSPYIALNYTNSNENSKYSTKLGYDENNSLISLVTETNNGTNNTNMCDYYYSNSDNRILLIGGSYINTTSAGLWCLYASDPYNGTGSYKGSRLIKY